MKALKRWQILERRSDIMSAKNVQDIIFVVACLTNYQLKIFCASNW